MTKQRLARILAQGRKIARLRQKIDAMRYEFDELCLPVIRKADKTRDNREVGLLIGSLVFKDKKGRDINVDNIKFNLYLAYNEIEFAKKKKHSSRQSIIYHESDRIPASKQHTNQ